MSITLNNAFNEEYDDIVQEGSTKQVDEKGNSEYVGGVNDDSTDSVVDGSQNAWTTEEEMMKQLTNLVVPIKKADIASSRRAAKSGEMATDNTIPIGNLVLRNKRGEIFGIPLSITNDNPSSVKFDLKVEIIIKSFNVPTQIDDSFLVNYNDCGREYSGGEYSGGTNTIKLLSYTNNGFKNSVLYNGITENLVEYRHQDGYNIAAGDIPIKLYTTTASFTNYENVSFAYPDPFFSICFKVNSNSYANNSDCFYGTCTFYVPDKRKMISDGNGNVEETAYNFFCTFIFEKENTLDTKIDDVQSMTYIKEDKEMNIVKYPPYAPNPSGVTYYFGSSTDKNSENLPVMFSDPRLKLGNGFKLKEVKVTKQIFNGEENNVYKVYTIVKNLGNER